MEITPIKIHTYIYFAQILWCKWLGVACLQIANKQKLNWAINGHNDLAIHDKSMEMKGSGVMIAASINPASLFGHIVEDLFVVSSFFIRVFVMWLNYSIKRKHNPTNCFESER